MAVTKNFRGSPHIDQNDFSVQYALSVGDFDEGGELCETPELVKVLKTHNRLVCIDGRFPHWVSGYSGERYSIIFYRTAGAVSLWQRPGAVVMLRAGQLFLAPPVAPHAWVPQGERCCNPEMKGFGFGFLHLYVASGPRAYCPRLFLFTTEGVWASTAAEVVAQRRVLEKLAGQMERQWPFLPTVLWQTRIIPFLLPRNAKAQSSTKRTKKGSNGVDNRMASAGMLGLLSVFGLLIMESARHMQDHWDVYQKGADQLTKDLLSLFSKVPDSFKKQYQEASADMVKSAQDLFYSLLGNIVNNVSSLIFGVLLTMLYTLFWLCSPDLSLALSIIP
eukprot:symbB.v1.2.007612.t1/scaffold467.1/size200107/7